MNGLSFCISIGGHQVLIHKALTLGLVLGLINRITAPLV